jgi:hypothetical protein
MGNPVSHFHDQLAFMVMSYNAMAAKNATLPSTRGWWMPSRSGTVQIRIASLTPTPRIGQPTQVRPGPTPRGGHHTHFWYGCCLPPVDARSVPRGG